MLLNSIAILSVVFAVLRGLGGPFWAWPLYFIVYYVELAALALAFLIAVSYVVDPDREQESDSPFYRKVIALYVEALVMLMRVRVKTQGIEKTPKDGRFLLVCNHQSNADPGILLHFFRKSQLAFISKKENHNLFCIGRLMHKILCQELDREDDRQALKVILRCIQILKEDKASVAVFPEGSTNHDELLHGFRPGVFKIAQKANVPIVVCVLKNTRPIVKNALRGGTDAELKLLGVIPAEDLKGKTTQEISNEIHAMMAAELGEALVAAD